MNSPACEFIFNNLNFRPGTTDWNILWNLTEPFGVSLYLCRELPAELGLSRFLPDPSEFIIQRYSVCHSMLVACLTEFAVK